MEIVIAIIAAFVLVAFIVYLGFRLFSAPDVEPEVKISDLPGLEKAIKEALEADDAHTVGDHLDHLDSQIEAIQHRLADIAGTLRKYPQLTEQVEHLATVQMLILKELSLTHEVQPQQDRLVKVEKEKSAK